MPIAGRSRPLILDELADTRLTALTSDKFWETLLEDLEKLSVATAALSDREARLSRAAVLNVSHARIARYRERATYGAPKP